MKKFLFSLILLLTTAVSALWATPTAYVVWTEGNSTLYFAYVSDAIAEGGTYAGQTVTKVWNGTAVTETGTDSNAPGWKALSSSVQHVVFDQTFSDVNPNSLAGWFSQMTSLEDITGLQYLNTSEATTTNTMFAGASKITVLDVSHFDMSKVTDATQMFYNCTSLATIKSNDTWTVSSDEMFRNCTSLKGAVDYSDDAYGSAMANPYKGYFTAPKNPFELASTDDWNYLAKYVNAGKSCKGLTFTMTKDFTAGNMIGKWDSDQDPTCFTGTFDGAGHILTVNYGSEEKPFNQDRCAAFRYIGFGAKVQNLVVKGDIYTSARNGAGVVGEAYYNTTLSNVLCTVNIHSSRNGDGIHGGLIGNVSSFDHEEGTTITGCSFQGSLLGSTTNRVGGLVGLKGQLPYLTIIDSFFAPKEVTVSGDDSRTFCRLLNQSEGDGPLTLGAVCYYTTTLGKEQGHKALLINDKTESCSMKNSSDRYDVSRLRTYTDGKDKISLKAFIVDEIGDDGDIKGEQQWFAVSGAKIYFVSLKKDLIIKDADGTKVELTQDGDASYHFTMPDKDVNIMVEEVGSGVYLIESGQFTIHNEAGTGWYDLQGRRLSSKPSCAGVYMNNGRKVVIK
jgi:surface protein